MQGRLLRDRSTTKVCSHVGWQLDDVCQAGTAGQGQLHKLVDKALQESSSQDAALWLKPSTRKRPDKVEVRQSNT